jgi:MOSC domain-containing protein YiiM
MDGKGSVVAVCRSSRHTFSKRPELFITLRAGFGVEGDAHSGSTVKHRSRVARDPSQPNLRQVHLIHSELFDELAEEGFQVAPGELGENVTTAGIDLLSLPALTRLHIGDSVVVEVTGLRNPCVQIEKFQTGLLDAVACRDGEGGIIRKTGIMSTVIAGGDIRPGDTIEVFFPPGPRRPLAVV